MLKFNFINIELLFQCFCTSIFIYACFLVLVEISFLYIIVPALMYFVISRISLNPPKDLNVNCIFGVNHRLRLRICDSDIQSCKNETYFCIAYRAAGFDSVENSLDAITSCSKNGCKFVYLDVRITENNVGVICSQENIEIKNENDGYIFLKKSIEESTLSEVQENVEKLDNSFMKSTKKISTIDEIVKLCESLNLKMMLNIMSSIYYKSFDSIIKVILKAYENNPYMYKNCVISSANPLLLYKLRKQNDNIVVALNWKCFSEISDTSISWLKNTHRGRKLQHCILELFDIFMMYLLNNFMYLVIGFSAVILPKSCITPKIVEHWERKNVRCVAAIVNLSAEKLYYENGLGIPYLTDSVKPNQNIYPANNKQQQDLDSY